MCVPPASILSRSYTAPRYFPFPPFNVVLESTPGACDFAAPAEYMARPPRPPPVVCLVECTYAAQASGVLEAALHALRRVAPTLPPYTELAVLLSNASVRQQR